MNNNRMRNFGGGTAIAITPLHRDIVKGLILNGELYLFKNTSFEVKYYIPLEFMLLALASMVSHIWLQVFFDENQPIPWQEIQQIGRGA